ncbi:MAG: hypothetical protein AABZ00_03855 [Chloroflexota bacterium]
MEIVIRNLLETENITALEDKVIVEYKTPIKEYRVEYKYNELKSRVVRGKSGDPNWTSIGYFLISAMFVLTFVLTFVFPGIFKDPYYRLLPLGLAGLALIAFSLRLIKYDKVWFDDKHDNTACVIKLTTSNRENGEKIISYMIDKINKTVESKID